MSEEIEQFKIRTNQGDVVKQALLPQGGAIVTMLSPNASTTPTNLKVSDSEDTDFSGYAPWGGDNLWPTKARLKLEKSTTAFPLIYKAVCMMYGDGIRYYRRKIVDGKEVKNFDVDEKIDDFFQDNNINRFVIEQLMDYKFFGNAFAEFILSKNKKTITNVYHLEAEFTRLSELKGGKIKHIGYSGEWIDESVPAKIGLADYRDRSKKAITTAFNKKFAWHTFFPSPGRKYYAMPPHGAIYRDGGWLDYSNDVPEIMNVINKNQINIKYHIKIPYEYWTSMYQDWETYKQEKRDKIVDEKLLAMNKWLAGGKNAGKSFVSHFAIDPITRKPIAGWEIIAIDDKTKRDAYIPSCQEADMQVTRALGIDPSIAGLQPTGGKMGAGSGSDKRTAFHNAVSISKAEAEIIFEPLYLIRDYNEWGKDVRFGFAHDLPTTLDKNPTGTEKTL